MLNMQCLLEDEMLSIETLTQVAGLPPEDKLDLVRAAIYSDDHLFKVVFRIALIVDPENTESSLEWIKSRVEHGASSNPV
jgi:hypothetical protein